VSVSFQATSCLTEDWEQWGTEMLSCKKLFIQWVML